MFSRKLDVFSGVAGYHAVMLSKPWSWAVCGTFWTNTQCSGIKDRQKMKCWKGQERTWTILSAIKFSVENKTKKGREWLEIIIKKSPSKPIICVYMLTPCRYWTDQSTLAVFSTTKFKKNNQQHPHLTPQNHILEFFGSLDLHVWCLLKISSP